MGMNSISSNPQLLYMQQMAAGMSQMIYPPPGMNMPYGYGGNSQYYPVMEMYPPKKTPAVYDMTDQQILDNFDTLVINQPECKLIQLRMDKDFNFFEKIFEHMIPDFVNYCIDGVTNILCLKIIEIVANQPQQAKRVVESIED